MKWTIRYLQGTTAVGLIYDKVKKDSFVDSDYAGDLDKEIVS